MLRVVGSTKELGSWEIEDGIDFKWTEGHNWVLDIDAPQSGSFEYKIVAYNTFTGTTVWESCENRFLEADNIDRKVELAWNAPLKTDISPVEYGDYLDINAAAGE